MRTILVANFLFTTTKHCCIGLTGTPKAQGTFAYKQRQFLFQTIAHTKCPHKHKNQITNQDKIAQQDHDHHHAARKSVVFAQVQRKEIRAPQHEQQDQQT
jgi:hypothetical protein